MVPTFRGAGCAECNGRGYISRMGIFEMMELNDEIRKLIMENADASRAHRRRRAATACATCAKTAGRKSRDGVTTVEEVMRVTQEF